MVIFFIYIILAFLYIAALDPEKIPLCVRLDFAALNVNGMDFFELRNAAIAFFRMAVASGSYTQHVVANGMIYLLRVFDYLCYLALPNETPKSSRKRSSITDEENTPRTPDTPSTSLQKFSLMRRKWK
jgi:hypothetical protein